MKNFRPEELVVIDIETASCAADFSELPADWQELWEDKNSRSLPEGITAADFYPMRAGVMAEFAKIICISVGVFTKEQSLQLRVKSFFGHDEKALLLNFLTTLHKINQLNKHWSFAGHNIKEFDIPFICRRLLINNIALPPYLDFQQMKPWETNMLDSFQYWRFGDYKNYTSLNLLAKALDVPSSKDDIDGSMVGGLYWEKEDRQRELNLMRIVSYCQKDVVTTANIFLRFNQLPILTPESVTVVS